MVDHEWVVKLSPKITFGVVVPTELDVVLLSPFEILAHLHLEDGQVEVLDDLALALVLKLLQKWRTDGQEYFASRRLTFELTRAIGALANWDLLETVCFVSFLVGHRQLFSYVRVGQIQGSHVRFSVIEGACREISLMNHHTWLGFEITGMVQCFEFV